MEFEWDEIKRQKTIAGRGVDVLYAAGIFEGEVLTRVDDRADYGEKRLNFDGHGRERMLRHRSYRKKRGHATDHSMERGGAR